MKVLKSSLSSVRKDRKITVGPPNRDSLGCVPGVVIMIFFACEFSLATENLERLKAEVSANDARIDLNDAVLNFNLVHDGDQPREQAEAFAYPRAILVQRCGVSRVSFQPS